MLIRRIHSVLVFVACLLMAACATAPKPAAQATAKFGGAAWEAQLSSAPIDTERLERDLSTPDYSDIIHNLGETASYRDNLNFINWLRRQGYAGNPILPFYLAHILEDRDIEETAFWLNMGVYYASRDSRLCTDNTAWGAVTDLRMGYRDVAAAVSAKPVADYRGGVLTQAYVRQHPEIQPTTVMCTHGLGMMQGKPLELVTGSERARRTAEVDKMFDQRVQQMKRDAGQ